MLTPQLIAQAQELMEELMDEAQEPKPRAKRSDAGKPRTPKSSVSIPIEFSPEQAIDYAKSLQLKGEHDLALHLLETVIKHQARQIEALEKAAQKG